MLKVASDAPSSSGVGDDMMTRMYWYLAMNAFIFVAL